MRAGAAEDAGRRRATPIRVLLVDDSATMRKLIRLALARDPRLEVVGEAADAEQARDRILALNPDVLTLDVEMPGMSGLRFLERLMWLWPMPVVMVSSTTRAGSAAAVEALSLGAVDCVGKPAAAAEGRVFADLADKLVAAAGANLIPRAPAAAPGGGAQGALPAGRGWNGSVLLVGASTGGVEALERLLRRFPPDCPPTVIVQHMPDSFLASFAARLDAAIAPSVARAADGMALRQGCVVLAPGGGRHLQLQAGPLPVCRLQPGEKRNGHRPSVDVTFESALFMAPQVVGALLTGMGRDGADGLLALRRQGAATLAQDAGSSVIWGMPRAAWENGGAEALVPIDQMAAAMLDRAARARPSGRSCRS